jgi:hypothetical protein
LYLFYVDESGTLDTEISKILPDGTVREKERLYTLTAFGVFEHKWEKFYYPIVQYKRELLSLISQRDGVRLELKDCEVKSTWLRIPKERDRREFLSRLTPDERQRLVDKYYCAIENIPVRFFSVVIDKRFLGSYMDRQKLHRKAWELLCERIESYMNEFHPKHKAILVADEVSRQDNQSLAMKHAYFLEHGTSSGMRFRCIMETPFFVPSELSEGVQFVDLCSYNVYRAFHDENLNYPFFQRMLPKMYTSRNTHAAKLDGIKVFPPESPLVGLLSEANKKPPKNGGASF